MAGDSSWRSTNYSDFDGSRLDRKSDIFANDEVQPCPGNDRWHQSELHLTRPSDIANGSRFGSFPATTTTATSSTSTPRQRSSDPSDGSHESSPRKELNRSRESSMSEYRGFKFQLLNNSSSNSRRSSLENNQICSNYSGRIDLKKLIRGSESYGCRFKCSVLGPNSQSINKPSFGFWF